MQKQILIFTKKSTEKQITELRNIHEVCHMDRWSVRVGSVNQEQMVWVVTILPTRWVTVRHDRLLWNPENQEKMNCSLPMVKLYSPASNWKYVSK